VLGDGKVDERTVLEAALFDPDRHLSSRSSVVNGI
jgi:hypothetical protein